MKLGQSLDANLWSLSKFNRFAVCRVFESTRAVIKSEERPEYGEQLKEWAKIFHLQREEKKGERRNCENRDDQQQVFTPMLQLDVGHFMSNYEIHLPVI